jgi:ATP-dependent protease ClpP protease subunit
MNKKNDDFDLDEIEDEMEKMFNKKSKVVSRSSIQSEHIYPLTYSITSFEQSEELFKLLLTANPNDIVKIYISTAGGDLAVSERIVDCIVDARERGVIVIGHLGFQVASAGTYIALNCTDLIISPNLQFTIHNWSSWGGYGHAANILSDAEFNHKMAKRWLTSTYENFLTEDELDGIITTQKDLHFDADEVQERWDKMQAVESGEQQFDLKDFIKQQILEIQAEAVPIKATPKPKAKAPAKKPAKTTEK